MGTMVPIAFPDTRWRKSSYSSSSGNCVEVACTDDGGTVAIRDSKHVGGPPLLHSATQFQLFVRAAARTGMRR